MVYQGSKLLYSKEICSILNNILREKHLFHYVEPFVGGANIIDKIVAMDKKAFDISDDLIRIFTATQGGWFPPLVCSMEEYYLLKESKEDSVLKAYVSFAGSWSAKKWGGYAKGEGRDHYNERTRRFIKQIPLLKHIEFKVSDYRDLCINNSLIYCDPPYKGTLGYSSGDFDTDEFYDWCRMQLDRHNTIVISERSMPVDFREIWSKTSNKTMSLKSKTEKLFILE